MPRKKNNLLKNQKRLISTRLMQISLLVDDYLYQQKPMSQRSASTYISEVSGYKDRCCKDVRSLQVIEKLTRCLKGIIHEQMELNGNTEDISDLLSQHVPSKIMLSPVYSTADEDLTQCEDIDIDFRINKQTNINDLGPNDTTEINILENNMIEIDATNMKDLTLNENPLNADSEVINLCDDIAEQINLKDTTFEPDFNVQNAISHLSIKDIEEALTPFSQECSQSILNSYAFVGQQTVYPLTIDNVDAKRQKPATEKTSDKIKIVLPKKNAKTISSNISEVSAKNINKQIDIVPVTDNAKPAAKKRYKNDKNLIANTETKAHIKPVKQTKKKAKVVKQQQDVHINQKPSQLKQNIIRSNDKIPLTCSKEFVTENICNNKTWKKATRLPIYNNSVVNDLSWIENIRFVREIQTEEYETCTESDTFWQNYTLPKSWNINDFNY